jgi:collagen type I/II/III/V/XI/XXIV/XXVII alpha
MTNYVDGYVHQTILLGVGGYASIFKVGPSGTVRPPEAYSNPSFPDTGIASLVDNAVLTNDGKIFGGAGVTENRNAGPGGVGVNLALSGDQLINDGGITGGVGGNSIAYDGYGGFGGAGGAAVNLVSTGTTSSNGGFILGGVGGSGTLSYGGGSGGVGLNLSGSTLGNSGSITGGAGGGTQSPDPGSTGGTGAVVGNGGTLNNSGGAIGGGNGGSGGYVGGQGGIAVNLSSGATLTNGGTIRGGDGFKAGSINDPHAIGGAGGVGVVVANGASATLSNGSSTEGGYGAYGYSGGQGGDGVDLSAGGTLQVSGTIIAGTGGDTRNDFAMAGATAGTGGVGINLAAGATAMLNSSASIFGGQGGEAVPGGSDADGGTGGAGLQVGSGSILTNSGSIHGGTGGQSNGTSFGPSGTSVGGSGGVGVSLTQDIFFNKGSIIGGLGGDSLNRYYGGSGGVGVYLDGGDLSTYGNISGGLGGQGRAFGGVYEPGIDHRGAEGDSVLFGPKSGTLLIDSTGSLSGTIGGFGMGDTIDIRGMTPAQVSSHLSYDYHTELYNIATYTNGTVTIALSTLAAQSGDMLHVGPDSGTGTDITLVAACYLRGTHIRTAGGEQPIETLAVGDLVMTRSGLLRPIRWIGRRRYSSACVFGNADLLPVCIRADALAAGVPCRDLRVSPDHAMFLDGMLIPARDLINGRSILRETGDEEVSYIHIEFDTHDVIFAEGALSESFADDDSRQMFDNYADYVRAHGFAVERAQFCAPRVEEGDALEAVRHRLSLRAAEIEDLGSLQQKSKVAMCVARDVSSSV